MASGLIAPLLGLLHQIGQRGDSASKTGSALARLSWLVDTQDNFKDKTPYISKSTSTNRDSWVDVVDISGSGYLTSVAAGAEDPDPVEIGFRIIIDGVEKFISELPGYSDPGLRLLVLNMRFETSLQVQRHATCASTIGSMCAIAVYQLD